MGLLMNQVVISVYMSIARTVGEHTVLAILYWLVCLTGGYLGLGITILFIPVAGLHGLALFIRALTASPPDRWRYWLALLSVLFVAGVGMIVFLIMVDIAD